jgi:hypothetical protein
MGRRADDVYEGIGDSASEYSDDDVAIQRYVPAIRSPLDPEQFEYYWNDELLTLYHQLQDTCAAYGFALFESLDFCEFCKFAYVTSSKTKPSC